MDKLQLAYMTRLNREHESNGVELGEPRSYIDAEPSHGGNAVGDGRCSALIANIVFALKILMPCSSPGLFSRFRASWV